jgi:hypothetical protein
MKNVASTTHSTTFRKEARFSVMFDEVSMSGSTNKERLAHVWRAPL